MLKFQLPISIHREPLLIPFLGYATGIALATWLSPQLTVWEGIYSAAAGLFLFLLTRRSATQMACLFLTLTGIGIAWQIHSRKGPPPSINADSGETLILSGCVVDPPVFYEHRSRFLLDLGNNAIAQVSFFLNDDDPAPDFHYGQRIEFEAKLKVPHNYRNPGDFDYVAYLNKRDIYWNASAKGNVPVTILPGTCGSKLAAAIFNLRTKALDRLTQLFPDDSYANGMLAAILIGETRKLDKIWTDHFRRTGTYHALVISGLHFSSLTFLLTVLFRVIRASPWTRLGGGLVVGWLYTAVSGWQPPVIRAAGGLTLFLIARCLYRNGRLLNLLAATGFAYLTYDPSELFDASFQLSFACVAAIGLFVEPWLNASSNQFSPALANLKDPNRGFRMPRSAQEFRVELRLIAEAMSLYSRIPETWFANSIAFLLGTVYFLYDIFVTSTVMQIALALPMLLYFHRFSLSGLTANLIVVPLMSIVVPFGILAILTGWHWPASIASLMLNWSEAVAFWHLKWAPEFRVPDPPQWLDLAFVAALGLCAVSLRQRKLRLIAVPLALAAFAALAFYRFPPVTEAGKFELTAIDVGQGDSLLAVFPKGQLMVVDAGGILTFGKQKRKPPQIETGEDVVSPFLWSRRIAKLDVVVSTHAHEDHAGGLPALIANFHPKELWTGANPESVVWSKVEQAARRAGTQIRSLQAGDKFAYGGALITVVAPLSGYLPSKDPKNDDSLAFVIEYGRHRFFLTGDMERTVELQLANLPHIDVLKVGHHGSKTSTTDELLDQTHPSMALISDGIENLFHHPHPSVLARLENRHIGILRTDEDGMIRVVSDGTHLSYQWTAP